MKLRSTAFAIASFVAATLSANAQQKYTSRDAGQYILVTNNGGQTLGYSASSGVKLLIIDGFAFKDLNKNGKLDKYEDWRLPVDERAKDLASQMSIEQIAGLMLYSRHQPIPNPPGGPFAGTYKGKGYAESGAKPSDLTDQQIAFLTKDNVRHVLVTSVESPAIAATWNNNTQALTEGLGLGIPANNSSDPRHGIVASAEYNAGAGGRISMWPGSLGMAATFDPAVTETFGHIAATEYRALGIATALSPQVDIASEPRWSRVSGTFGEDPQLATDMGRAYIDGFQTSAGDKEIFGGWGYNSVNAMVKHWPSGGSGEGGRDAHYGFGKYAVYPGNNLNGNMKPFLDGAFKLNGKTSSASAVMPYYTISYGQDTKYGENVGNNYNKYIIKDLLRDKYGYDGVVCTDWLVTGDETSIDQFLSGKSWGVEKLTVADRHYKALMAGVDQFGGNSDAAPVLAAYQMGVKDNGEAATCKRFEQSAVRLLRNIFRVGLFENPYLNPAETQTVVGKPEFMKAGYDAQLKSIVMLKNKANVLPLKTMKTVYVPKQYTPAGRNFLGMPIPEKTDYPVNINLVKKYFRVTDDPAKADYALVFINSPASQGGYSADDVKKGGNGYLPISLQYKPYTATDARATSIAGGDPLETFTNRSYKGKTSTAINTSDLNMVTDTYAKMKGKPVIVSVMMNNPTVFGEFEGNANALLVQFGVQDQAVLDIITGKAEPSGLLPLQMPADMHTVENQAEDVPLDMKCYRDAQGHVYDFAYGMNWKGVINDARTAKYSHKK
ncbi:glycoside hydrolase family 3 protein [Mucilaginibacter ginkgonis]|uniref:beta-glucosidase n=1 Tax=Mucilaginibacter ginkgonis TaxID=2682091 RepID=A0A6I4I158_9SPHI|nr:glycoside hydrolase family 3 N-terminal domain-containing protein [Mucilaginibacter ginkgonis]QQL48620.1 glycoside hydrolase family 3 C-terminal domain-containing protein [Mucilaginibacter ginkgonis]